MNKKKWRDVKNALVMVVVMAAMMSTATYAWFTFTDSATVTGMQMAASGSSGLKVSLNGTAWLDTIDLRDALVGTEDEGKLKSISQLTVGAATENGSPLSNLNGFVPTFYKPVYGEGDSGTVTGLEAVTSETELASLAAVYNFQIKAEGEAQEVALEFAGQGDFTEDMLEGGFGVDNGEAIVDGSFMVNVDPDNTYDAKRAVRVGLKVEGSEKMIIWEPNEEKETDAGTAAATAEAYGGAAYESSVATNGTNGQVTRGGTNTTSDALFTADTDGVEVTVYVWLEGTDPSCVNEIRADQLVGQLKFVTVEE